MASIDWIAIKNEYINTNISYRKLSEKYNVSFATLQTKAKKESWKGEHDKQYDKTMTKIRQKTAAVIVKKEINRMGMLLEITDGLSLAAQKAIDQLSSILQDGDIVDVGMIDTFKMKQIASVAKDLKEIQTTLQSNQKQDPTETDPLTQSLQNLAKELSDD